MMNTYQILLIALLLAVCQGFLVPRSRSGITNSGIVKRMMRSGQLLKNINVQSLSAKKDLFSVISYENKRNIAESLLHCTLDDLFNEDEDEEEAASPEESKTNEPPKRKYLDEKWILNAEDAKEFPGFTNKGVVPKPPRGERVVKNVPLFVLLYKFRREYKESSIESTLADHVALVKKNKRILNSDVINMKKARGIVLLWAGLTEDDQKETRDEITKFVESDPFIEKDMIETWDVIDLSKTKSNTELPVEVGKA